MGWTEDDYQTAETAYDSKVDYEEDASCPVGIRAALDSVAHRLQQAPAGFEVTEELEVVARQALEAYSDRENVRDMLQAVSSHVAKQAPAPRFPVVTDEQALEIEDRCAEFRFNRPGTGVWEDIRDAINEVMGGEASTSAISSLRAQISELWRVRDWAHARIAEREGELRKAYWREQPSEPYVNASPADALRPDDRHGQVASEPEKPSTLAACIREAQVYRDEAEHAVKTRDTTEAIHALGHVHDALRRAAEQCAIAQPSEPAGDLLTVEERKDVEAFRNSLHNPDSTKGRVIAVVDRLAPKPVPVSPLDALLAEMEARKDDVGATWYWTEKLKAAIAAERGTK